tara:strand:- start:69 stop:605 length:537 start_codon:yes stop_codon:yes gene_type:complete
MVKSEDNDGPLIKNPFVCNSATQVRISLDKDPRRCKGNTSYVNEYQTPNGNIHMVNQLDPKLSYCFGDKENKPMVGMDNYDYEVPADTLNKLRTDEKEPHKEGLPLSFLQVQSEEEGIEWYKLNYPKIPDELLPIIARYHWGEPITKKGLKNEKKKIVKKAQKKGLVIENKKIELKFD